MSTLAVIRTDGILTTKLAQLVHAALRGQVQSQSALASGTAQRYKLSVKQAILIRHDRRFEAPVLEYACENGWFYALRVRTFDTALPFGRASLDALAQTFLGACKVDSIGREDKARMLETFRRMPSAAYLYAAWD